jgi:hypothetical protein
MAVEWFARAADLGNQLAKTNLGMMLAQGKDVTRGSDILNELADAERANGQFASAVCRLNGIGAPVDREQAFDYLKRALGHGNQCAGLTLWLLS